jgi:hypothetical protein
LVTADFDVVNPTDADLVIKFVQSDARVNGVVFAHFEHTFDNFVVPARGTANSGNIPNVILTQGAVESLGIIPLGELDVSAAQTVLYEVKFYIKNTTKLIYLAGLVREDMKFLGWSFHSLGCRRRKRLSFITLVVAKGKIVITWTFWT